MVKISAISSLLKMSAITGFSSVFPTDDTDSSDKKDYTEEPGVIEDASSNLYPRVTITMGLHAFHPWNSFPKGLRMNNLIQPEFQCLCRPHWILIPDMSVVA